MAIWLLSAFGGMMALVCGYIAWQWMPGPPIIVSPGTTYITSPLRADGLPDYERWLLEKYRADVSPENNAGVLLYQALWPGELDRQDYQAVCDELGLAEIPSPEHALQDPRSDKVLRDVKDWCNARGIDADETIADDLLVAAFDRKWTSEAFPPLADWLTKNQQPLNLVVEATKRPKLYLPSPSLLNDDHEPLIATLLPAVQPVRLAARGLAIRSMWHLGHGRPRDAWNDAFALHRLACLLDQGPTVIEKLIAVACHGMAQNATLTILAEPQLPPEFTQQIQKDLASLPQNLAMADALGTHERLSALDAVVHMQLYGPQVLSEDFDGPSRRLTQTSLDWNLVLTDLNRWYDQLAAAIAINDRDQRLHAIDQFEADLDARQRSLGGLQTMLKGLVSRRIRSQSVGMIVASLLTPALSAAMSAEDRNTAMQQLVEVAAALATYRALHGNYPDTLQELVPAQLPTLTLDKFRGKPLTYQRDGDGYLLYCLGDNGIDDGGSNTDLSTFQGRRYYEVPAEEQPAHIDQIPPGADDFAIRVPRPAFKLPSPPDGP